MQFPSTAEHMNRHTSLYNSKESLSVCLSVCVCVCVPQISLLIRIRLTWEFQHGCCLVKGCATLHLFGLIPLINYLINALPAGPGFAGGLVLFCSVHLNWLLWINETKRVQSVPVWGDLDTRRQQSGIRICGCLCVASCSNPTAHLPSRRMHHQVRNWTWGK